MFWLEPTLARSSICSASGTKISTPIELFCEPSGVSRAPNLRTIAVATGNVSTSLVLKSWPGPSVSVNFSVSRP